MIATASLLIYRYFGQLEQFVKEQLFNRLNKIFDSSGKQPLYKIFYGFNHDSTISWLNWIKSQSPSKQDRAFRRLVEFLSEPADELGSITEEVVRAVILFEHDESYDTLLTLVKNSRNKWVKSKALNLFYEPAVIGLMKIDEENTKEFLLKELSETKNLPNTEKIKSGIVKALSAIEDEEEKEKIFFTILLDHSHSLQLRESALNLIETLSDNKLTLVRKIIDSLLKKSVSEDLEIFKNCFEKLLRYSQENLQDKNSIALILKASKNNIFCNTAAKLLSEKLIQPEFNIEGETVYELLESCSDLTKDTILEALNHRHQINKDEKELIHVANSMKQIAELSDCPTKILSLENKASDYELPEFCKKVYSDINKLANTRSTGINLLTGFAENDKYLCLRKIATEQNKNFIFVDMTKIILSPDKISELELLIQSNQPCIIYLKDITKYLNELRGEAPKRILNLEKILEKHYNNSRVTLFASLDINSMELRDDHCELFDYISNYDAFTNKLDIAPLSSREKMKIYNYYELKLKEDREVEIGDINTIFNETEGFANIEYLLFLLKYMKSSLLCHGKFISIPEYNSLIKEETDNKEEEEVPS